MANPDAGGRATLIDSECSGGDRPPSRARIGAFLLLPILFLIYTANVTNAKSILALPGQSTVSNDLLAAFPQGWKFFSRSPKDEMYSVYLFQGGQLKSVNRLPATSTENIFGLSRRGRAQGVEIGVLTNVDQKAWVDCGTSTTFAECGSLAAARVPIKLRNRTPAPSVCGDVAIFSVRPVDYEFRENTAQRVQPTQGLHLRVQC